MKDEIKKILEQLKDNIPIEEYRSEGTSDGLTHYEEDKDSWQYKLYDYITNLQEEKDKFKLRCYKSLKLIRDNYGLLDKYGIDMIDDILNGGDENED